MDRRSENQPINYRKIINKYLPEGAKFTINKEYVIPDNGYISIVLRRGVRSLRQKYDRKDFKKNFRIKVDDRDF